MTTDPRRPQSNDATKAMVEADGPAAPGAPSASAPDDLEFERSIRQRPRHWRLAHLMALVAVMAVVSWMFVTVGFGLIIAFVLFDLALACGLGFLAMRLRAARREMLLGILCVAAERSMPLAPAIEAFSDQFRGRSRGGVLAVAGRLRSGDTVPQALEAFPEAMPRDALLLAWAGETTGRLPEALRFARESRSAHGSFWKAIGSRIVYLLNVILLAQIVLGALAYWVVPRFRMIFREFNAPLPEFSNVVMNVSDGFIAVAPLAVLIVLVEVAIAMVLPFMIDDWMSIRLPFLSRLTARRHTALILRSLSLAVGSNQPIEKALAALRDHYPTGRQRSRLIAADVAVRRGGDWIYALHDVGLLRRSDAELLGSAASVGNLAWAMRELAETCERRQQLRVQAVAQTLLPVAVLMLGATVGVVALAYFLPLVSLIQRMAWP